ncbi:hypothetical protein [Klebsiella variicola]|nr:hypothetical protein [Klebsiella variicola]
MEWRIEAIVLAIGFVVMINGWIIPYILGGGVGHVVRCTNNLMGYEK